MAIAIDMKICLQRLFYHCNIECICYQKICLNSLKRYQRTFRENPMFFDYKKNRDWTENLSVVMQIGLTMAGCICFCFFVGLYLDRWLGTGGILTVVFILFGIAGGGNVVYRQIMDITKTK